MKIPHGKAMSSNQIRKVLDDADSILKEIGIDPSAGPAGQWLRVRDWLISKSTPRSGYQAAHYYIDLLHEMIGRLLVASM
jgi:hypothetical protein